MRILYSHYLIEDSHPAVLMVEAITKELRGKGHEVLVHRSAGPSDSLVKSSSGKPQEGRSGKLRKTLWFLRALSRNRAMLAHDLEAIEAFKPDVVLARQDAYSFSMPLASRRMKVPLVTYADAPTAYETRRFAQTDGRFHPPLLVEAIERWTLQVSQQVVTVSEPAKRLLLQYRSKTPIHVVSNGIDPKRFPKLTAAERAEARSAIGLTAPVVAGFVGSFKAFHGIDNLRELILATSHRNDLQWLLIGDGPEREGLENSLDKSSSVVFLGARPSLEVGRLLGLVDIAVAPHPQVDGEFYFCPLKILEYMAAGCTILAGNQGDIPRILDNGRVGMTIAHSLTSSWVEKLIELLDQPDRREMLGISARERALAEFTWARTASQVEEILRKTG